MKLIIDIPDKTYKAILNDDWIETEYISNTIRSIQDGTLLEELIEKCIYELKGEQDNEH